MNAQKEIQFQLPIGKQQLQVDVSILFGNPKYNDCRNFGICKMALISDTSSFLKKEKQCARATLIRERNDLWIYFIKDSMDEQTRTLNFDKGSFLIEKDKMVRGEISSLLKKEVLIFNSGEYSVMENEKYLIVKITS